MCTLVSQTTFSRCSLFRGLEGHPFNVFEEILKILKRIHLKGERPKLLEVQSKPRILCREAESEGRFSIGLLENHEREIGLLDAQRSHGLFVAAPSCFNGLCRWHHDRS